ncbi:hypothetical protein [Dehalogenimonas alkenigignens]|uniref:hypothetical protein n=1 Tax=Dehalogenimonas alkenigignens TaxID=1217799 RepID=UPI000D571A47|nr:hypothetical protein [Dehalogenimonas alkenigignens]PVV83524.1 hypothetical protein DD509_06755 [Dehalogenimonas alkenigignens]
MKRLLDWYWKELWLSVVQPAGHQLLPDIIPPRRFIDDFVVAFFSPILFIPAALRWETSKDHPLKPTEKDDCADADPATSNKECF